MKSAQSFLKARTLLMIALLCGFAALTGAVQEARADILPMDGTPTGDERRGAAIPLTATAFVSSTQNLLAGTLSPSRLRSGERGRDTGQLSFSKLCVRVPRR